jgi:hypothetical protein
MKSFNEINHGINPQKQRQKRIRTWSSDSGCDVACNYTDMAANIMDESMQSWTSMLEKVVRQEVAKAKKIANWVKEEITNSLKGKLFCLFVCNTNFVSQMQIRREGKRCWEAVQDRLKES